MDKHRFRLKSPIAANLPSHIQDGNREFSRRIHAKFLVGSDRKNLVDTLSAQGFAPAGNNTLVLIKLGPFAA
jgi:hypothetical protein